MKKQIEVLEKDVDAAENIDLLNREIKNKEQELGVLLKKYSDKHPEVIMLRKQIDSLNESLEEAALQDSMFDSASGLPDNPGYIQIETQIASTELEIAEAERNYAELTNKYAAYQRRVVSTPQVEQEYKILLRDYENAQIKYQDINTDFWPPARPRGWSRVSWRNGLRSLIRLLSRKNPFGPTGWL